MPAAYLGSHCPVSARSVDQGVYGDRRRAPILLLHSEVVSDLIDVAASIDEEVDDSADDGYPNLDNIIASEIVEEVTGNTLREEVDSRHIPS